MTRELSMLEDGRLLDGSPMRSGEVPVVFVAGKWVDFEGTLEEYGNSRPLTKAEIATLPAWVVEAEGKAPEKEKEQKPKRSMEDTLKALKADPRAIDMTGKPGAPKFFVIGM